MNSNAYRTGLGVWVILLMCGSGTSSPSAPAAGQVVGWGGFSVSRLSPGRSVTNIDAGGLSLALVDDGTVLAWGPNDTGQTSLPDGLTNVIAVSAGAYHGLALRRDGTVAAWGNPTRGLASVPPGLNSVIAISAG